MEHEFTADDIKDAAKAARVYCHRFTEDMFESLMELERRIAASSYLDAVLGLIRLEEEKGISCTEALDTCEKLLKQKAKLEDEVPDLEKRRDSLVAQIKQSNTELGQIKRDASKARQKLEQIKSEYAAAEKKLEAFNKKAEKEKDRIEKEIEDCYQQVNVTKEDIMTAGKVKADVESHGFALDLVLDISKEFAGFKNVSDKLAEGLKEHGSLNKYLDNLADWGNKERARILAEIAGLESQKKGLNNENIRLGNVLSQRRADIAGEEELRRFHRRYVGYSVLLEKLAKWEHVYFMRCGNPVNMGTGVIDKKLGNPHFWTEKPPVSCPHCGYPRTYFDTEIYQFLNWPAEEPFKMTLGD